MRWCLRAFYCVLLVAALTGCSYFDWRAEQPDSAQPGAAISGQDPGFQADTRPLATTLVYDCNGFEVITRVGPGEMALWLPDQYVVLPQVRSASGALYEDGDISFWSKGDDVMLSVGAQDYFDCRLQPHRADWEDARRRGVVFRAVGNATGVEPGWQLEISRERQLLFATEYGMRRVVIPQSQEQQQGATRKYQGSSGAHILTVDIENKECVDPVSSRVLTAAVVVTLDDTPYRGCGQYLAYPWQDDE